MAELNDVDVVAARGGELARETRQTLAKFRETVYEYAATVLVQIVERYPQVTDCRGASIKVISPGPSKERLGYYHVDRVQLADGRIIQAICGMAGSKEPVPVFLALPRKEGNCGCIPDRRKIGSSDRNDCVEPTIASLFRFLDLVVADLPGVLDHIEVWSST